MKVEPEIGFLDLPREIRDMIYYEVCSELKREGLRWEATSPRTKQMENEKESNRTKMKQLPKSAYGADTVERPTVFSNCAIMRTCRQVHSEFASVLYASPLQFFDIRGGINEIPLSPLYAGLVRAIFAVETCLNDADNDKAWREQLQIATGLSKMFPNVVVLRLGWFVTSCPQDPVTLTQLNPAAWEPAVKAVEKSIKRVKKESSTALIVPHNLEVVQIKGTVGNGRSWPNQYREVRSEPTPITEAIAKLRAKQPLRKGLRTRKT